MNKIIKLFLALFMLYQIDIFCDNYYIKVNYNVSNTTKDQLKKTMAIIKSDFENKNNRTLDEYVRDYYKEKDRLYLYDTSDALHIVPLGYIAHGRVCLLNGTILGDYAGSFGEKPTGDNVQRTKLAIQMMGTDLSWHNFPVFIENALPAANDYLK